MNNFVNNLTCCTTSILSSPSPYPTKIKVNISGGDGRLPSADILRQSMLREKAEQLNDLLPETNCTSHSRNEQQVQFEKPRSCLNTHDSLTTADQHWLDFT